MKIAKALLFVVALVALTVPVRAEDAPKNWIKGIDAVKVEISVSQTLVDAGFPGAQLRTQAELQLRQAGLRVDPSLQEPRLYIELTGCRGPGTNNYACYVYVTLFENAKVSRNAEEISTVVWGPDLYVLYIAHDLNGTLLNTARARLDGFLNDWLRANPR